MTRYERMDREDKRRRLAFVVTVFERGDHWPVAVSFDKKTAESFAVSTKGKVSRVKFLKKLEEK